MKKIALLGIAAATVLVVGVFANIGLFGNNALAAEPSMEQKIKTIFWSVTNKEYGLKKIMNGMYVLKKDMKNDMQAMNDDLQQKKSFYEVEDVVLLEPPDNGPDSAVTVKLVNCDDSIPLEKRAFNIETLGVRTSELMESDSMVTFRGVIVDKKYVVADPVEQVLTFSQGTGGENTRAFTEQVAASDQVQYIYFIGLTGVDFDNTSLQAVAIGQMPQGCEVTIESDATREGFEAFPGV